MTNLQPRLVPNHVLVTSPSTFPSSRRPVYIYPTADVTAKNKPQAYPLLLQALSKVSSRHPDSRILVHTVSYELSNYLAKQADSSIRTRIVSYETARDRQRAIDRYLLNPASILLAASLDRGLDLPGDDCRAIVVCKIPYPNLADKQTNARLYTRGGQLWYTVKTVRSLVQMTGRGMRSETDYCESYILDKQFLNIYRKYRTLLPLWWQEALVWDKGVLL
jgi:ATP-dependent DNA helicase DinG